MAKRSLKQIEEGLRDKLAEIRPGGGTEKEYPQKDLGGGTGQLGSSDIFGLGGRGGAPMQIDIGMGGAGRGGTAAGKPRVSPKQARELGIIKQEPQVWSKTLPSGERIPVATPRAAKGKETISPPLQTPQEKLIAQAQQRAKEGEPTIAVTDPRVSKILDKMFPEKLPPQRPQAQTGPRVDIKPDAGQRGPKVTPDTKTGLERVPGPGTREVWHTRPGKEPKSLKPDELAARERRKELRVTPDIKSSRERRAAAASLLGHGALGLGAYLYNQMQKGEPVTATGTDTPVPVKPIPPADQAAEPKTALPDQGAVVPDERLGSIELPQVDLPPGKYGLEPGQEYQPSADYPGAMGGSIIVQPPDRKKEKDSEIEKTLPPVTVTAEPEPRREKEPEPRREPKPEAPQPEAPAPAPVRDSDRPGLETGKKTSDYEFQYKPGYTGRPFKEQALAEKYFNHKHQILSEQKLKLDQEQLEQLRQDPNVRRMLDLISRAEGADYDTIVGHPGKNAKIKIKDFSTHPQYVGLRTKYGPSDAAGRYQILSSTYRGQAKKLGITDFSPESQDKIAISILNDVGALAPAMQGDFKKAIVRSNNQWVSLPGTKYEQGYGPRGWKWVEKTLKDLGADDTALASVTGKSTTIARTEPKKQESKPQYYAIGDSQAQGVAGYGGEKWDKSMAYRGASILNPKQFEKHLANIEKIPPGSVVAISGGGNDINSAKPEVITGQVNKLIAAAKARGLQVIHLLPTTTDDPKTKQSREQLRQAMMQNQTLAPIVDLGVASKKDPMKLHLDRKGYATIAKNIEDMLPIATATAGELPKDTAKKEITGYPAGTQVQPDWSKYKYGDRGPLIKNAKGEWTTLDGKSTATDPVLIADLEKLSTNVKAAEPTPKKDSEESWFEKLYGTKKAKAAQDRLAADTKRREEEIKKSEKPKTVQSVSGTIDYSKVPAAVEQPAVKKLAEPKVQKSPAVPKVEKPIDLQRDQVGLVKAKRELSDFEKAFAAARAEQGPGGKFTWTDPKTGKTTTFGTLYKGETPPPKTVPAVPVDQSLSKDEELVDIPVAQATNRFQSSTPAPSTPAKSEIQKAVRAFDRKQDIDRVIKQFDDPVSTPAPKTPEELASDELWKDIRASAAEKSSEEISAAAQRAKQELDTKIAADQSADTTATTRSLSSTTTSDEEDDIERIIKQSKQSANAELKEAINTESNADLHDILRLAGRLK